MWCLGAGVMSVGAVSGCIGFINEGLLVHVPQAGLAASQSQVIPARQGFGLVGFNRQAAWRGAGVIALIVGNHDGWN